MHSLCWYNTGLFLSGELHVTGPTQSLLIINSRLHEARKCSWRMWIVREPTVKKTIVYNWLQSALHSFFSIIIIIFSNVCPVLLPHNQCKLVEHSTNWPFNVLFFIPEYSKLYCSRNPTMTFQVSSSPVECNRVLNQQDYSCAMQPNAVLKYRPGICIEEMSGVDVQMQVKGNGQGKCDYQRKGCDMSSFVKDCTTSYVSVCMSNFIF